MHINFKFYKVWIFKNINIFSETKKIILTYFDNSIEFYTLKKKFSKITFISIQNGWRGKSLDIFDPNFIKNNSNEKLSCDYILCFNEFFAKNYRKIIDTKTIATGSIIANNFKPIKNSHFEEITFLLQFRKKTNNIFSKKSDGTPVSWDELFLPTGNLLNYLSDFCNKNKIPLKIIGRSRYQNDWNDEKKNS